MSATSEDRNPTDTFVGNLRNKAAQSLMAALVILALSALFGNLLSLSTGFWMFVGLTLLSLVSQRVGEFSPSFAISAVGVLAFLGIFLPADWIAPFQPLFDTIGGFLDLDLNSLNLPRLVVYSAVAVLVFWVVDIRILSAFRTKTGRPLAVNASTVANRVRQRADRLSSEWIGVFGAAVIIVLSFAFILLEQIGQIGGQVFEWVAQAPVLFGAFMSNLWAFISLGGQVPILSDLPVPVLTANEFAVVAGAILVFAYAAKVGRS